jgi:hypothetical protein
MFFELLTYNSFFYSKLFKYLQLDFKRWNCELTFFSVTNTLLLNISVDFLLENRYLTHFFSMIVFEL